MSKQPYEKWGDMPKKMQENLQAITELNVQTIQNLSYLKPEHLINIKKPEDLLETQIKMAVENGKMALDYMQKSWKIWEEAMLSMWSETKRTATDFKKSTNDFKNAAVKATDPNKRQ